MLILLSKERQTFPYFIIPVPEGELFTKRSCDCGIPATRERYNKSCLCIDISLLSPPLRTSIFLLKNNKNSRITDFFSITVMILLFFPSQFLNFAKSAERFQPPHSPVFLWYARVHSASALSRSSGFSGCRTAAICRSISSRVAASTPSSSAFFSQASSPFFR